MYKWNRHRAISIYSSPVGTERWKRLVKPLNLLILECSPRMFRYWERVYPLVLEQRANSERFQERWEPILPPHAAWERVPAFASRAIRCAGSRRSLTKPRRVLLEVLSRNTRTSNAQGISFSFSLAQNSFAVLRPQDQLLLRTSFPVVCRLVLRNRAYFRLRPYPSRAYFRVLAITKTGLYITSKIS